MTRKPALAVQIGLTVAVVVCAVAVVLYFVSSGTEGKTQGAREAKGIRVASSALITREGGSEPKVVLSMYEDFLCPYCRAFEQQFGPMVDQLIDSGAVAADYYMVAILDRPQNQNYSSRAGGAAYCAAADSTEVFRRFHAALFAQQPSETGDTFPTDTQLAEVARQAGASPDALACITSGRYADQVKDLAKVTGVHATPTVRINGQDYDVSTPEALASKINVLLGR
ncbi:DsbA family protein [soil metagenome]